MNFERIAARLLPGIPHLHNKKKGQTNEKKTVKTTEKEAQVTQKDLNTAFVISRGNRGLRQVDKLIDCTPASD